MAMKAIISDVHANLEALRAVLADIESLKSVKEIICLGDIVGYGPQPRECLDLIQKHCKLVLMGNHEDAILNGIPANFSPRARRSLEWTRKVLLENPQEPPGQRNERRAFMQSFKRSARIEGATLVHGSPRDPVRVYVLAKDAHNREKMHGIFEAMEDYCFCGHSHTPGIFTHEGFSHPSEIFDVFILTHGEKALINVGSVGQPRDGDPRSSYITYEGDTVVWRRVKYDFEAVIKKMQVIPDLDKFLAERLRDGK